MKSTDYPLVIIGAGAAGLGASARASRISVDHMVLEASHRIGGRALTETLDNGVAVDLGCHWMHSASRNPMVGKAHQLGFSYAPGNPDPAIFSNGRWQPDSYLSARNREGEAIEKRICDLTDRRRGRALWDAMDSTSPHIQWYSYWYSLMHSNDPDQTDIADVIEYLETNEDYPLKEGYGALIEACGANAPVQFNTPVTKISHDPASGVVIETATDTISAEHALITVSTGVLGAGDIVFDPPLPHWKTESISALPLGNCNNLIFPLQSGALADAPSAIQYDGSEHSAYISIRPFEQDFLFTAVAGRFAWWLEKQGERAAENWFRSILVDIFGAGVESVLGRFRASAWGFDPWVRGAYSSLRPEAGAMRAVLARPVDDRLWFAGEATSAACFNTAHGAWISGEQAVEAMYGSGQ